MAKIAVHKDFHTILSFSMQHLLKEHSIEAMEEFLRANACNIYKPLIADRFCESTRITNEEICSTADLKCSVEYDQENGRCVQKFWDGDR